jgi:hypothetical protein
MPGARVHDRHRDVPSGDHLLSPTRVEHWAPLARALVGARPSGRRGIVNTTGERSEPTTWTTSRVRVWPAPLVRLDGFGRFRQTPERGR